MSKFSDDIGKFNGKLRAYNWCFTSFKESAPDLGKVGGVVAYMVYQLEKCPSSEKKHWQGYLELNAALSMSSVKKLLNDKCMHLEVRRGTQEQAINYCKKRESRAPDASPVEWGEPKRQGKRTDLDTIVDCIESGMTMREILLLYRGNALRHLGMVERGLRCFHNRCDIDDHILKFREFVLNIEQASRDLESDDESLDSSSDESEVYEPRRSTYRKLRGSGR